jgi:hypothetical protein
MFRFAVFESGPLNIYLVKIKSPILVPILWKFCNTSDNIWLSSDLELKLF